MRDKYGYIGIETLLNFCENSKDHAVTPNDFMRMNRVQMPSTEIDFDEILVICDVCGHAIHIRKAEN